MTRALVTGAGGFVGANLVRRLLADGDDVTAVVRPRSDAWRIDGLRNAVDVVEAALDDAESVRELVRSRRPERVFHLAAHGAYSWQVDAVAMVETNILGTVNLVRAAAAAGADVFVHAGSSSEYGSRDEAPSERDEPRPESAYALTKAAATSFCTAFRNRTSLRMVTLRLYSAYGPWEDPRRFVPRLVAHALEGRLPPLVDPRTPRDFVYVGDVCEAFVRAVAAPSPLYNVGSGRQTTVGDVVAAVRDLFGVAVEPAWSSMPARRWDTAVWVADPSAIWEELGWRASTELRTGLERTAAWLRGHPRARAEARL